MLLSPPTAPRWRCRQHPHRQQRSAPPTALMPPALPVPTLLQCLRQRHAATALQPWGPLTRCEVVPPLTRREVVPPRHPPGGQTLRRLTASRPPQAQLYTYSCKSYGPNAESQTRTCMGKAAQCLRVCAWSHTHLPQMECDIALSEMCPRRPAWPATHICDCAQQVRAPSAASRALHFHDA